MLKRRMLRLLEKLITQMDEIHRGYGASLRYTQDYGKRLSIIRKVLVQEKERFEGRKVSDRIVSIDRHYVRPIVRGKETKSVEFGAKVNNIQIDGISFIEHNTPITPTGSSARNMVYPLPSYAREGRQGMNH